MESVAACGFLEGAAEMFALGFDEMVHGFGGSNDLVDVESVVLTAFNQ